MRRLLPALVTLGLGMATLAVPAAGQSVPPPPVRITSVSPACAPLNQPVAIAVGGTSARGARGSVILTNQSGQRVAPEVIWSDEDQDGRWVGSRPLEFTPRVNGYYTITARDGSGSTDRALFSSPCRNPRVVLEPDCSVAGRRTTLTVSAFDFAPNDAGYVYYDYTDPNTFGQSRIRIEIDGAGNFATTFDVVPPARDVPIHVEDLRDNVVDVRWPRCPPPGVTPTTTTTTAPPIVPDPGPGTTTSTSVVTLPPGQGPTTTTSTSVVPPPTPGASLTLSPAVGPPGFVTSARGAGFPPGPVMITWSPGLGFTPAVAGPDGTFSVSVLVFPRDRLGPRIAVASAGGVSANAPFLVVPPTMQPSASDVTEITRIRRFLQR